MSTLKLSGVGKIRAQLKRRGTAARSYRATVGYDAPYAIFVHENLEANHPRGGQAKFLEEPARVQSKEFSRIFTNTMRRKGMTLKEAVKAVADYWLSESLKLVPIDTGFLYLSGFSQVSNYALKDFK
jgi:hypothetical protein